MQVPVCKVCKVAHWGAAHVWSRPAMTVEEARRIVGFARALLEPVPSAPTVAPVAADPEHKATEQPAPKAAAVRRPKAAAEPAANPGGRREYMRAYQAQRRAKAREAAHQAVEAAIGATDA